MTTASTFPDFDANRPWHDLYSGQLTNGCGSCGCSLHISRCCACQQQKRFTAANAIIFTAPLHSVPLPVGVLPSPV